ncbi:MAG: NAD(P)H-flavin reductase [Gammaproteobacteria bacterium]
MPNPHSLSTRTAVMERLTADVMRLFLQLPPAAAFPYHAGQYIDILHQGAARSFSLACAPRADGLLELHIRRIPGNPFTDFIFEDLRVGAQLVIAGPFGRFFLQAPGRRRRLFLAGGTGFAPIKSFIETQLHEYPEKEMSLYWGARTTSGLYLHELACRWQRERRLHYVPVLSACGVDEEWSGRTGLVHEALLADWPDLNACEIYASGPPPMIDAARAACIGHGLPGEHFHTERY